jgi:glycosyltransferase involved in cell wall biosynthesis
MNIVHIVPGSGGGFYCQNCVRDIGLVKALHAAGHDVLFVPMYLPFLELAGDAVAQAPVFYGAVNVYLRQKIPFYHRLPAAWRRRLDAPRVLRWAAARAGTTQADGLGDLTLGVLDGRDGPHRRELEHLTDWLKTQPRPDIIHLSNALLLGLAPTLRDALGAAIVCTLQDEDTWLDALPPRYRDRGWRRVAELCRAVDAFTPVSAYYAEKMRARLNLPEARCHTILIGIDVDAFSPPPAPPATPTLGFLSELTPPHGLDILVEAFLALRRRPELAGLRLRITGGNRDAQTPFLAGIRARIAASEHAAAVEFVDACREPHRSAFLRSLSVLSVPATRPEAFGLFQIEAMACGVPVAQPRLGAYPEIVAATGGGVIYDTPTAGALAEALFPLLANPALAARIGAAGRAAVIEKFSLARMVADVTRVYRLVRDGRRDGPARTA